MICKQEERIIINDLNYYQRLADAALAGLELSLLPMAPVSHRGTQS